MGNYHARFYEGLGVATRQVYSAWQTIVCFFMMECVTTFAFPNIRQAGLPQSATLFGVRQREEKLGKNIGCREMSRWD